MDLNSQLYTPENPAPAVRKTERRRIKKKKKKVPATDLYHIVMVSGIVSNQRARVAGPSGKAWLGLNRRD